MSLKLFAGILAGLTLILGLAGLFSPLTGVTASGHVKCGTAATPDYPLGVDPTVCEYARDARNAWAIPVLIVGVCGLVALSTTRRPTGEESTA